MPPSSCGGEESLEHFLEAEESESDHMESNEVRDPPRDDPFGSPSAVPARPASADEGAGRSSFDFECQEADEGAGRSSCSYEPRSSCSFDPPPKASKLHAVESGFGCGAEPEEEEVVVAQARDVPSENLHAVPDGRASMDLNGDRRVMGAAATLGGATGAFLLGPVPGAILGVAALYTATREDQSGTIARKVGSMYLQVSDRVVDVGVQAVDQGVKKLGQVAEQGCQRLSEENLAALPAPIVAGVNRVLNGQANQQRTTANLAESTRLRQQYPDSIPVMCERSPYASGLPQIRQTKFVVSMSMNCGEFKYLIHKQLREVTKSSSEQTIYIFLNGLAPKNSTPMSDLYAKFQAPDGFLYIKYGAENALG